MITRRRPAVALFAAASVSVSVLAACGGTDDGSAADRATSSSLAEPDEDALPIDEPDEPEDATPVETTAAETATTETTTVDESSDDDRFPDVLDVDASFDESTGTWSFAVTMSSPYDTPDRYADGWRVIGPDGTEYGTHTLMHDHANEQPFTRRQTGVEIPDDVSEVTVEGRDQANGFGGDTVTVPLARS